MSTSSEEAQGAAACGPSPGAARRCAARPSRRTRSRVARGPPRPRRRRPPRSSARLWRMRIRRGSVAGQHAPQSPRRAARAAACSRRSSAAERVFGCDLERLRVAPAHERPLHGLAVRVNVREQPAVAVALLLAAHQGECRALDEAPGGGARLAEKHSGSRSRYGSGVSIPMSRTAPPARRPRPGSCPPSTTRTSAASSTSRRAARRRSPPPGRARRRSRAEPYATVTSGVEVDVLDRVAAGATPSSIGRWNALRPEMRPVPPARLLMTAVRTASARSRLARGRAAGVDERRRGPCSSWRPGSG